MTYREKLSNQIETTGSNLCVGLDPRPDQIKGSVAEFLTRVIDETAAFTAAYKPNIAYFEAMGLDGLLALEKTLARIPETIPVILDAKRGDIGETQKYYAKACFEVWGADAVTLNPYMGAETLEPFLDYKDKGIYLLAVTSNPGAKDIELRQSDGRYIFEYAAEMSLASEQIGLVVGLTNAADEVLSRIPDAPLLIPGLGAQGGNLDALKGENRKAPLLVNVSRGITFAEPDLSFAEKASRYAKQIADSLG
tara:strand:+ start:7744 stop:8496 length:753 start_codon:yes stop_codon:yes gene_type:complete